MNCASNGGHVLLNTYKHRHSETISMFGIFVSMLVLGLFIMSDLCHLFLILFIILILSTHIISLEQAHFVFFAHFLEYTLCFWLITWKKKANNFETAKV